MNKQQTKKADMSKKVLYSDMDGVLEYLLSPDKVHDAVRLHSPGNVEVPAVEEMLGVQASGGLFFLC